MVNWANNTPNTLIDLPTTRAERSRRRHQKSTELKYNEALVSSIVNDLTHIARQLQARTYLLDVENLPYYANDLEAINQQLDTFTTRLHTALIQYKKK